MKISKFAATYVRCIQIGEDEWRNERITKVFLYSDSILDVMDWLEYIGCKKPGLGDVSISEVYE